MNLIPIEDIIEAYKTIISLTHKDQYAGLNSAYNLDNAISSQIDKLYPDEVEAIISEFNNSKDDNDSKDYNKIFKAHMHRLSKAHELTERMVMEHYSPEDQFTFLMATA